MSDDLISRKAALELIRTIAYSMELSNFECKLYGDIYDGVKDIQVAFNKETVIEQLKEELELSDLEKERCARENPLQFDSAKGYANGIANAIEVVEKGGLE